MSTPAPTTTIVATRDRAPSDANIGWECTCREAGLVLNFCSQLSTQVGRSARRIEEKLCQQFYQPNKSVLCMYSQPILVSLGARSRVATIVVVGAGSRHLSYDKIFYITYAALERQRRC